MRGGSIVDIIATTSTAGGIYGTGSAQDSFSHSSSKIYAGDKAGGIAGIASEFNDLEDSSPIGTDIETTFTGSSGFIGSCPP